MRHITTKLKHCRALWLGLLLLAMTATTVAEPKMYDVHSDHRGAPVMLTDETGAKVWEATYDPFGVAIVNEDPDNNGQTVEMNLRLPGQYYDKETGTYYNYYRDYDPNTGRYIQSDPIGLGGGLNTYGYVGGNPINYVDPTGEFALGLGIRAIIAVGTRVIGGAPGAVAGGTTVAAVVSLPGDTPVNERQKQTEYEWYKTQCDTPPPPTGDECQDLLNEANRAFMCADLRAQWDERWGGDHSTEIARQQARGKRLMSEYESKCDDECDIWG
jgi:RHS repeat-associated protein